MGESLIVYGIGLFITIIAGLYFAITSYPNVITATETLILVSPPLYMIPIFLPFGILVGELVWMWIGRKDLSICILMSIECIFVTVFSFLRIIAAIPISGHTLILFFYLPHHIISNRFQYPLRVLFGLLVLLITSYYKIFLWNDPITFFLGLLLGIVIWIPGHFYRSRYIKESSTTTTKHLKRF